MGDGGCLFRCVFKEDSSYFESPCWHHCQVVFSVTFLFIGNEANTCIWKLCPMGLCSTRPFYISLEAYLKAKSPSLLVMLGLAPLSVEVFSSGWWS